MFEIILFASFVVCIVADPPDINEYHRRRNTLSRNELRLTVGGNMTLSDKESEVNNCIMQLKFQEIDYAFDHPRYYNFSQHYFKYKDTMRKRRLYQILKVMPKGALLHVHDMSLLGPDYLMNITYMQDLYVCLYKEIVGFRFSSKTPNTPCKGKWQNISKVRSSVENVTKFDEELRKHFTLVVDDPDTVYGCITDTWTKFMDYFLTVDPLLTYRPVWEKYFYDALMKFREDNVLYVEFRSVLPSLYELDGTAFDPVVTAKAYRKVIRKFVKDYPDFIGAKLIYAPSRRVNRSVLSTYLQIAKDVKKDMPDIFAGFDLVGQEDLGEPLIEFAPQLLEASESLDYFFHAGETDWLGTLTDENLMDAILLGAKRIGHAYALAKHPLLLEEVIKNDIGLEINIISNAVLSLVRDVRNHPLSTFLSKGLPVVISSDDPGAWEAEPLTDDFYVAFVGAASRLADLRLLKQLALNSFIYSSLEDRQKTEALRKFKRNWDSFINNFKCPL